MEKPVKRVKAHLIHTMMHILNEGYCQNGRVLRSHLSHIYLSTTAFSRFDGVLEVFVIDREHFTAMRNPEQE